MALSLTSEMMFKELWPDSSISVTTVILFSYSGEDILVLGGIVTEMRYKSQRACNSTCESDVTSPSLRNCLECLKIHWSEIYCINKGGLQKILQSMILFFKMV